MACISNRHEHLSFGRAADGDRMPFAEPGVGPTYGPDRTAWIEHIDVKLSFEPVERRFAGEARIRIRPFPGHRGTVAFDLDEVNIDAVSGSDGEVLDWAHAAGRLEVRGVLDATTVVVRWHGVEPRQGMYFTGPTQAEPTRQHMAWTQCQDEDAHFVLPCHDHPGIKHPWTITLEGPAGYTLLSNGAQLDVRTVGDRVIARFEQADPMPAYLFTAVCAKLSVVEARWRDRPVRYLVPTGEEAATLRAMGRTPEMMEAFSRLTGVDFPWPRYDQVVVHDFIFGGMENTGCTTMTRLLLVDDKAAVEWDPEMLVSHELAHQWFGDLVTCQDWSQGWLNESWATFMEMVWWEQTRPVDEATWFRWEAARTYFDEDSGRYRRPIVSYDFRAPIDVFDRHLYEKGACVLATLRNELGEQPFWLGVRHYLARHAHGTVHSRHFQRALEEATGRNLDRFFHQWVHGAGHPEIEVSLAREDELLVATVKQSQSGEGVAEAFVFPLRLEIEHTSGATQTVDLPIRERERTWAIPVAGDVAFVRVDPGARVLARVRLKAPRGWLEKLVADTCPVLATRAAKALLDDGSAAAFQTVVKAMGEHPFHGVRGEIAAMLGHRGGSDARDVLLRAHGVEADPRARRRIAEALGHFRDETTASALLAEIDKEPVTWHHFGALLTSLGRTRDPRAVEAIGAQLARRSWGDWVIQRALDALAETEDVAVFERLIERTRAAFGPRVRAGAARALGRLADRVEAVRERTVERLCEMLVEPGYRPQLGAIAALATIRDDKALGPLDHIHRTAPDGRTRRAAYEAMVRIKAGRTTEEGLAFVRRRLDALAEENHQLRQRIDKLERTTT